MKIQGEPVKGYAPQMVDDQWLSAWHLNGAGDIKTKIVGLNRYHDVPFQAGRKCKVVIAAKLDKTEKELVLLTKDANGKDSAGKFKALAREFGNKTEAWLGQEITIYDHPECKHPGGKIGHGIRIRGIYEPEGPWTKDNHDQP